MCDCARNGLLRCSGIAEIRGNHLNIDIGGTTQTVGDLIKFRRVARDQAKTHSFFGEFCRDRRANATIRARYQCNFTV